MEYEQFRKIFNDKVFGNSKAKLIKNLAHYPERYVGLFRPTTLKAKIIQNFTQSNEIKFGNAFEILIEEYFSKNSYDPLEKILPYNGGRLVIDQLVRKNKKIIFIEQKIRDDHDSSKKRGQVSNFEKKLSKLIDIYEDEYRENKINGYFYFIDPSLAKNKNYYNTEIEDLSKRYGVRLKLVYGKELFTDLNLDFVWGEVENHLKKWKRDLLDLPDVNFDSNPNETFEEIKNISASTYRKLFNNEYIVGTIFPIIFPEKTTLKLLKEYFDTQQTTPAFKALSDKLKEII